jgi:hypothetical protein
MLVLGSRRRVGRTRMHTHFAFLAKRDCAPAAFADRFRAKNGVPMLEQAKYMYGLYERMEAPARTGRAPKMAATSLAWNRLEQPWGGKHGTVYKARADRPNAANEGTNRCSDPSARGL